MLAMEDRLLAANEHLDANRIENAALIFESVLDINPRNADAQVGLAKVYLQQGDLKKAQEFAGNAASCSPNDPDILVMLAKTEIAANKLEAAETALYAAIKGDNTPAEAYALMADLLVGKGCPVEAEALLNDALSSLGPNINILAALATIYFSDGLYAPALEAAQEALAIDPENANSLGLVGAILSGLKDYHHARPFVEKAHLKDPANPLYVTYLAQILIGEGEISDAVRTARRATQINSAFLLAWGTYVRAMAHKGEAETALAEFTEIAKAHPNRIDALVALASAFKSSGLISKAIGLLQPLLKNMRALRQEDQRKVASVLRDCCLSASQWQQVQSTYIGLDLPAMVGCNSEDPTELREAFDKTVLLIERQLDVLDVIPLLRFVRPLAGGANHGPREIHGSSSLTDLMSLVEDVDFKANDIPHDGTQDVSPQIKQVFPLSAVMAFEENKPASRDDFVPYLAASPERIAIWQKSLAELPRPLVGIAWNETRPGLMLDDMLAFFEGFQGTLVSVVWDQGRHQLSGKPGIIDAGVCFQSLGDAAACLSEMDLIIGPDGLPLHIAGALGRNGIVLCQPDKDWYWADIEGQSAWYPHIQVFQTADFAHWSFAAEAFIEPIKGALSQLPGGER